MARSLSRRRALIAGAAGLVGAIARPLAEWRSLFHRYFEEVLFEPYDVTLAGVACWRMVYFKGRARAA